MKKHSLKLWEKFFPGCELSIASFYSDDLRDAELAKPPAPPSTGKYIVFKRWDNLKKEDNPQVVIFFVNPTIAAGLHGLANFRAKTSHGIITPFATGCDAIMRIPMLEGASSNPRAVIGGLDPFARMYMKRDTLTFSVPWKKFLEMLDDMEESFLNTEVWQKVVRVCGKKSES